MEIAIVIPARYASTRFPGKPLALINGKAMIEHVIRRLADMEEVSQVIVATDDERIFRAVEDFGGKVVITPSPPTIRDGQDCHGGQGFNGRYYRKCSGG